MSDDWRDEPHDGRAPIRPGSFVTFRHNGKLRGGPCDGTIGKVAKGLWHEDQWHIFTEQRLIVPASKVRSVHAVDERGESIGCWVTKTHGLDGTGPPRTQLSDLEADELAEVQQRYDFDAHVLESLRTGCWDDSVWAAF